MESHVHFPQDVTVVGQVPVRESEDFREDIFYVLGEHRELAFLGKISIVSGKRGIETAVDIVEGPSEYYYG
jgi:hypothetical protein